jgi:diguanylate cyclase (GGDEF)-like protein
MKRVVYPCAGALVALVVALGLILANGLGRPSVGHALMVLALGASLGALGYRVGRREDALVVTSNTDPLTDLANRRHLEERLARELARALESTMPLALLALDLDDLKRLNDEEGHAAGDRALATVGEVLSYTCRSRDLAARIGGDEFCVLMPRSTANEAAVLGERIRAALHRRAPGLTLSIGAADLDQIGTREPRTLVDAADHALYEAKRRGRDRVIVFREPTPAKRAFYPSRCDDARAVAEESGIRCTTPSHPPPACLSDLSRLAPKSLELISSPELTRPVRYATRGTRHARR